MKEQSDLMKPRYKVIADYPSSPFTQNQILIIEDWMLETEYYYNVHGEREISCKSLEEMPHLFRKLEWWEERKPEEMPEYLKGNIGGNIVKVQKWSVGKEAHETYAHVGRYCWFPRGCTPSTEAEYRAANA